MTHQIVVGLGVKGADERELDELTRGLGNELRQIEVQSVERLSEGVAPPGSKGDPFTIGWLAVTLMPIVTPIVLNKVFDILVDWTKRAHGRTIKVSIGQDTIELSGATRNEREKLLHKWLNEVGRGTTS